MSEARTVRAASGEDAAACAAIYAPYVTGTAVTFELAPPDTGEMAARIARSLDAHAWLVVEVDGAVAGYAYGARFQQRPSYRWSCEVSIYLREGMRRTGAGRELYGELLGQLAGRGYRVAVAGMTLPNEASEGLHAALGFTPVGVYRRIGYKLGAWHDVAMMQRRLAPQDDGQPPEPH
ncbi:MAG TPA: GNAT family N-acetyltransferase [Solirubrobacteraceae bacterium]|nr:GNAT family N-acetyltransferase [Solirubrobacteraceae bacterium]